MSRPPSPRPLERRQRVQSAEMGMAILKALSRLGGAASLTLVAAEVEESTAKVHRYMVSLIQEGLVEQDPATQRYHLGREAIQIGLAAIRQCDPIRLGEPALVRLREQFQITCFLAVMGNKGPTIVRFEEPALPVTINTRVGSVMPLLWSATGQVFLSYLDDPAVQQQARDDYLHASKVQKATLPGRQAIETLRRSVRAKGCAVVHDTLLRGISAVAAPLLDYNGRICAVITALGASAGFDARPTGPIARQLCQEAAAISTALGYAGR